MHRDLAHPRSEFERQVRFQGLHGLRPTGPHVALTHEIFDPHLTTCKACKGTGKGDGWPPYLLCRWCSGYGSVFTITGFQFDALRGRILDSHPGAEVRDWVPGPILVPGLRRDTREIIDLAPPPRKGAEQLELW